MSLPPKAVSKSAAAVGSGPGTGPSASSQLRATLTTVPLQGPPVAQQPPAVPPTQYPSLTTPPSLLKMGTLSVLLFGF